MSLAAGRPVIAIPGPSPVPDRVLRAAHRASPDIYGDELADLNLAVMAQLKRLEPDFTLELMASDAYPVSTLRAAGLLAITRSGLGS